MLKTVFVTDKVYLMLEEKKTALDIEKGCWPDGGHGKMVPEEEQFFRD